MHSRIDREYLLFEDKSVITKLTSHNFLFTFRSCDESRYPDLPCHITLSTDHPFCPPRIVFSTRPFHPNIELDGRLDRKMIQFSWTPSITLSILYMTLQDMLTHPILAKRSVKGKEEDIDCEPANQIAAEVWDDLDLFRSLQLQYDQQWNDQ